MFFRLALSQDLKILQQYYAINSLQNIYIIENEMGILGICLLNKNDITLLYAPESIQDAFLNIIEEFLFMRYDQIFLQDINLSPTTKKKWQHLTKIKPSSEERVYTMYVPQKDNS